jgi:hypothetical protein
MSDDEIVMR